MKSRSNTGWMFDLEDRPQQPASQIVGTHLDFIRDAYDQPVDWLWKQWRFRFGTTAFLIGRGWSFYQKRYEAIREAGLCVAAINNYPKWAKPDIWITGDPPVYFWRRILTDPDVAKFMCLDWANSKLARTDDDQPDLTLRQCPNIHFYHHRCNVGEDEFLETPWVCWGTAQWGHEDKSHSHGGVRASMLCALRVLWHVGFRRVYLLGCDFTPGEHPCPSYYRDLCDVIARLKPQFEKYKFEVINANPDSHLRVFPTVRFDDALQEATA